MLYRPQHIAEFIQYYDDIEFVIVDYVQLLDTGDGEGYQKMKSVMQTIRNGLDVVKILKMQKLN